ncbi:5'-methylthioadenosine/S-adenosylhomocysteine nucleosidase family protein [Streptomyces phaeofaciens]|uniref:5'-methylthioadenosine/S-adenosylhomocysteine nucleosidase family protein n=1 Tax=Streptomyces phaeofaciens TaxID=68254 RepID=UPI0036967D4B
MILTSLPVEYAAVRARLVDVEKHLLPSGLDADIGRLGATARQVVLVQVDPSGGGMAAAVSQSTRFFRPEAIVFVGLAAGLREDVAVGDVVVATRVYAYGGGEDTPEDTYARPRAWHTSHRLTQVSRQAVRRAEDTWNWGVHFRAIAAADPRLSEPGAHAMAWLRRMSSDVAAVEMEASGLAHAAHVIDHMEVLTIRGISDVAGSSPGSGERSTAQERAAANAGTVAVAVLSELGLLGGERTDSEPSIHHAVYRGDHLDFRGGTFMGSVIGKVTGPIGSPHGDGQT